MLHLKLIEEPMSEPLSGLSLAKQSSRLKQVINGAIDATKRYPQYRFERFMEALHASGFDVTEIQRVAEIQHSSENTIHHPGDSALSDR